VATTVPNSITGLQHRVLFLSLVDQRFAAASIWKTFFCSLPWLDLLPDQDHTVVTSGLGTYATLEARVSQSDYCTAVKTPDGVCVIAYLPTARTITVTMASMRAPAHAAWFDPTNGAYTTIPGRPVANTGTRLFTPPGKNHEAADDWVLVLDGSGSI
jgi:collagenase-like protein with putative collagen-binding domain